MEIDRNKYLALTNETYFDCLGRVTKVVGLTIESVGPDAKLNDLCRIFVGGDRSQAVMAQDKKMAMSRVYRKPLPDSGN